jgi:hypothetical protein
MMWQQNKVLTTVPHQVSTWTSREHWSLTASTTGSGAVVTNGSSAVITEVFCSFVAVLAKHARAAKLGLSAAVAKYT